MRIISRRAVIGGIGVTATALAAGYVSRDVHQHLTPELNDSIAGPLRMAWPNPQYEAMLTLCQRGIFKRFGLEIILVPTDNAANAIALFDGSAPVDLAVAPVLDWLPAFYGPSMTPPSAKIICSIRTGYYRLVVRRDKRINKLGDLRGKSVGVTKFHGADRRFLSIRLRRKFMPPTEGIAWVELPASQMASAFLDGKIDAFMMHDAEGWRTLQTVGRQGWNMLDSMTGMARNRIDLALGVSQRALHKHPAIGRRLAACFYAAQQAYRSEFESLVTLWQAHPDAPADVAGMLRRQTGGSVSTNALLRVQIAQYVDEFKMINLITGTEQSAQIAQNVMADI